MWKQWKTIGLIAAVLAIGSFSGAYAQRGGGGGGGHGGGGGGGHGGGGGGGHGGGGGGGHPGGGGFGGGGGAHAGGGNFGGSNFGGGGVRVGGGGVNIGSGGSAHLGSPNLGGGARQGSNFNLNSNVGRIGVGANTNTGAQFHNLNNAINQANRGGPGGVGLGNNYGGYNNGGRYSSGYRGNVGSSYFFGAGSPFGGYYGSPYYRNGYGYGGPIYGYNRIGLGLGYGSPFGYGYGLGGYGGGYGGGYSGYGYGPSFGYQNVATYQPVYIAADGAPPTSQPQLPAADTQLAQAAAGGSGDFAMSGEQNFKAGKYNEAIRDWQHALVDEPRNGAYIMLLSQAYFATGKYNEAAGAVQAGTQLLPEKDWGIVIQNYKELYANQGDYTTQLRALEKARNDKSDDPALRFLLGWHYNYLGYGQQGLTEIDKARELAPKDEITSKVRDVFAKAPQAPQAAAR